jgi:hypothetical protein
MTPLLRRGNGLSVIRGGILAVDQSKVSVTSVAEPPTGVSCHRQRCPLKCRQAMTRSCSYSTTVLRIL